MQRLAPEHPHVSGEVGVACEVHAAGGHPLFEMLESLLERVQQLLTLVAFDVDRGGERVISDDALQKLFAGSALAPVILKVGLASETLSATRARLLCFFVST
jgi:hypothetical protein